MLVGLSPTYAVSFVADHPFTAFIAMGAVVLVITGAETLLARHGPLRPSSDPGVLVRDRLPRVDPQLPGPGRADRGAPGGDQQSLLPAGLGVEQLPLVVLATIATIMASQAVISGAFSVSRQAVRLGYVPQLTVRHTSTLESGQIYVPAANWLLFAGVLVLMAVFRSSAALATAYGLAVTGTFLLTTTLLLPVLRRHRVAVGTVEAHRHGVVASAVYELHLLLRREPDQDRGGWVVAAAGRGVGCHGDDHVAEGPTHRDRPPHRHRGSAAGLRRRAQYAQDPSCARDRGVPAPDEAHRPLALRANVEFNHVLHERVVIVSVLSQNVPHIALVDRLAVDELGHQRDGILHLEARFGFQDEQDLPEVVLRQACGLSLELDIRPDEASYFLSPDDDRTWPLTSRA